jgi:hypothetical protein
MLHVERHKFTVPNLNKAIAKAEQAIVQPLMDANEREFTENFPGELIRLRGD